jgi:ABC-type bacteriocin/lantibiotic exporter with double-glycine peptidase domain
MKKTQWIRMFLKQYKGTYSLAVFLLIVSIISNLLMTGIQKYLVDNVFIQGQYDKFSTFLILFCTIAIIYLVSWVAKDMLFERVDSKLKIALRKHAMMKLHQMPVRLYQNQRVAKISSDLDEYINSSQIFTYKLPDGVEHFLNLILLCFIVGYANWVILITVFIFGIVYVFLGKYFLPLMKKTANELQEQKSEMNVDIEEGIASTREVVAYHREAWEQNKMNQGFSRYFEKVILHNKLINKQMLLTDPLKWGASLIVLGYGGYGVMQGTISLGMFIIIYQFTSQLLDSFNGIYHSTQDLGKSFVSVERAGKWLNINSQAAGEFKPIGTIDSIDFKQISFSYIEDQAYILNSFDVKLPIGKKLAFVGASGGGKSTVAQLLIRFYEPTQGSIIVNNRPLDQIGMDDWMQRISIVFQDPYLFPDTIRENLLLGREYSNEKMIDACIAAQIHDTITALPDGYETVLGERGITLSGGQRQRLALARSILGDPEILILDEATSALDLETERKVMTCLDDLRKGRTTIIIAHRLSTIENADAIYVMEMGKIIEYGHHEMLMKQETSYKRLVLSDLNRHTA